MPDSYRTISEEGTSEVVEKKSRFLGRIACAKTQADAEAVIAEERKRYYDARHHCFAYLAGEPDSPDEILRAGDDGEPQGTAGRPMLEVLQGLMLHRAVVVVTRYFGGTLLGTGGLVRAYSKAAKEAAEQAHIVCMIRGVKLRVQCSYTAAGKLNWYFAAEKITVLDTGYGADVVITLQLPEKDADQVCRQIIEYTDGKAEIRILEKRGYAADVPADEV